MTCRAATCPAIKMRTCDISEPTWSKWLVEQVRWPKEKSDDHLVLGAKLVIANLVSHFCFEMFFLRKLTLRIVFSSLYLKHTWENDSHHSQLSEHNLCSTTWLYFLRELIFAWFLKSQTLLVNSLSAVLHHVLSSKIQTKHLNIQKSLNKSWRHGQSWNMWNQWKIKIPSTNHE